MKIILISFLLSSTICAAKSSFFAGANGSINMTTLLNKEDKKAPDGMLNKKNGTKVGYGVQIGYNIKNRIRIGLEANYLQYRVKYRGKSDTANVKSFEASAKFKYYQIPLVLSYRHPITERISFFVGVGFSFNYMNCYEDEFYGRQAVIGLPNVIVNSYYYTSGKSGIVESTDLNEK